MIIDIHTHLGTSIFGYKQTSDDLLLLMDELGIDKSVVIPVKPIDYHFSPQNDYIAKEVKKHPDRFIGFCRVDPRLKDNALIELKRCIEELGFKGLFLHPWEETFQINSDFVFPLIEYMKEKNLPVMISGGHPRVADAWQISDLAKQFPEVTMIITSGGQINISGMGLYESEIMLTENKNTIMETSGIYREDFIEDIIKKLGKEKVVFGSNSPEYELRLEILRGKWAHINDEEKNALLWENTERILNL